MIYIGITRGKSACQLFRTSKISIKPPSDKIHYYLYQLQCLKEAEGDLDSGLLGQEINLKYEILSYDDSHKLVKLLSRSTNKHWKSLNLSHCGIDNQGCTIYLKCFIQVQN